MRLMAHRIFIHGLESSNQGTKAVFFRNHYPDMILPTFTGPLTERMEKLNQILSGKTDLRMVGSSFGGLMAALFAMEHPSQVARMVLLAPAIHMIDAAPGKKETVTMPVSIYHGTHDTVILLPEVQRVAPKLFHNLSLHVVDDDHYLHKTFKSLDWDALLS